MDNLFTIERISQVEQTFRYRAQVDAGHSIFRGHFPQSPVVPGVCTMGLIKECAADALSRPLRYDYIKECKFTSAIIPSIHREVEVCLTIKSVDSELSVVAEVSSNAVLMVKLKATLLQ